MSLSSSVPLWLFRLTGAVVVAFSVGAAWTYLGLLIAVLVGIAEFVMFLFVLRITLGPVRGRGDRLLGETAVLGLGAFAFGAVWLLLTFDSY